jgi:hypothetical protein
MTSLAQALPAEINRVREIQDSYKDLRGMPNVNPEPTIAMMEHAITAAINAQGSGDVVQMCRAYDELKGFGK